MTTARDFGRATRKAARLREYVREPFDVTGAIIAFEDGVQTETETLQLFQYLVDTGRAWTLQGSYGRLATRMVNDGVIEG